MIMIDNYEMVCTGTFIHVCILFKQYRMIDSKFPKQVCRTPRLVTLCEVSISKQVVKAIAKLKSNAKVDMDIHVGTVHTIIDTSIYMTIPNTSYRQMSLF